MPAAVLKLQPQPEGEPEPPSHDGEAPFGDIGPGAMARDAWGRFVPAG